MTVYPIAGGKLINVAAFRARYDLENSVRPPGEAWVQDATRDELTGDFANWEGEVKALLDVSICFFPPSVIWSAHGFHLHIRFLFIECFVVDLVPSLDTPVYFLSIAGRSLPYACATPPSLSCHRS